MNVGTSQRKEWLVGTTDAGTLVIHVEAITATWVPNDVVNHQYNVAGAVALGSFGSLEEAKAVLQERYSIFSADWSATDNHPFAEAADLSVETHAPEVDGHHIVRHGIHWK